MKYLLIITLSFFIASPAFAARSVEGTVPDLPPLQPIPEGTYFNASQNIQFEGVPEESNNEEENLGGSLNNQTPTQPENITKRSSWWMWPLAGEDAEGGTKGFVKNMAFLLFVVVVLGAGVYYFKRGK